MTASSLAAEVYAWMPAAPGSTSQMASRICLGFVLAGLVAAPAQADTYTVPSGGMLPTYKVGQEVRTDDHAYDAADPQVNDVVVFHPPVGASAMKCGAHHSKRAMCPKAPAKEDSTVFLKRVVALPGDTVALRNGHVIRNGERAKEPFIRKCSAGNLGCRFPKPIVVPKGAYFMLGDNRGESDDSRYWGPVPKAWILGRVE
jgi:signal peptidase I